MHKLLNIKLISPSQEALKELFTKKIDKYVPSITFLNKNQQEKFKKRCVEKIIHDSYEIDVNYKFRKDVNKDPYIIYLTKKQAKDNIRALKSKKKYTIKFSGYHFKKICRETLNNNYKFEDLLNEIYMNEMKDYASIYFSPKSDYWTLPPRKDVELYKKPTKRTISIGAKKRPKEFLKKFVKKNKIENYYATVVYLDKKDLKRYLKHI